MAGVGFGAGVGEIWPTPARSCRLPPTTDDGFVRTIIHPSENMEKREDKKSGSVQMKRHLVPGFRLIEIFKIILGPLRSVSDCANAF